jgi:hypothetical protein
VPWARTWRTVPRSGLPGRLCEWQVQSHPLMHVYPSFINTTCWPVLWNASFYCKTWLDSHPLIVMTIPWWPRICPIRR